MQDSELLSNLGGIGDRIRAAVRAGDFSQTSALLHAYVRTVKDSASMPVKTETLARIQQDWNDLTAWTRDAIGVWREQARLEIVDLTNLRQYAPAELPPHIFALNG